MGNVRRLSPGWKSLLGGKRSHQNGECSLSQLKDPDNGPWFPQAMKWVKFLPCYKTLLVICESHNAFVSPQASPCHASFIFTPLLWFLFGHPECCFSSIFVYWLGRIGMYLSAYLCSRWFSFIMESRSLATALNAHRAECLLAWWESLNKPLRNTKWLVAHSGKRVKASSGNSYA